MKTLVFALLFLNYKGTEFLPETLFLNYKGTEFLPETLIFNSYIFPTRNHQVAKIQGLENLSLWQGLDSF